MVDRAGKLEVVKIKQMKEETRKKISERMKGNTYRLGKKGHKLTEETKRKMSLAKKGNRHFFGHKHTEEAKRFLSESQKGQRHSIKTEFKKGFDIRRVNTQFKKGHPVDEKTREAVRKNRRTQIFPAKDSKIEVKIQKYLKKLGYEFFTHQYIKIKHEYQCDILIPALNLVIECDGDYWHKYPIGREIDHIRTKELIKKGFKVLRLWEGEIKLMGLEEFKIKISMVGDPNV